MEEVEADQQTQIVRLAGDTELIHPDEVKKQLTDHIPLGRRGEAWEVAELVGFLCTPRASYITGQVLAIDGGLALTG